MVLGRSRPCLPALWKEGEAGVWGQPPPPVIPCPLPGKGAHRAGDLPEAEGDLRRSRSLQAASGSALL